MQTFDSVPAATELHLSKALQGRLARLARRGHPHEVCGLLVGRVAGECVAVDRVREARNLNQERAGDRYELDPADFLAVDAEARRDGLEIVGIWHTHPDCPARPSSTDLAAAWEGYSYLIVAVAASGEVDLRSWRLDGGRFHEEPVVPPAPAPAAPALRFTSPLREEQAR